MAAVSSFLVRKSGVNYEASFNGSHITHKPNGMSFAKIIFDNADDWITGVFTEEDEIDIYVDSVSAANQNKLKDVQCPEILLEQPLLLP